MRSERHVRVLVVDRYGAHAGGVNSTVFRVIGLHEFSITSMTPVMRSAMCVQRLGTVEWYTVTIRCMLVAWAWPAVLDLYNMSGVCMWGMLIEG